MGRVRGAGMECGPEVQACHPGGSRTEKTQPPGGKTCASKGCWHGAQALKQYQTSVFPEWGKGQGGWGSLSRCRAGTPSEGQVTQALEVRVKGKAC